MDFIVVSDESVNDYGFRLLSSGGDFSRFKKNPIMLYVHERTADNKAKFPIGKWSDLTVEPGGTIIAKPIFDENDPDGKVAKSKFEGGFLNTASIGFTPLEWSEDPSLMLPGQLYPTITKWKLLEISIADLPVNENACRLSYKGRIINLSGSADNSQVLNEIFSTQKPVIENSMKSVIAYFNTLALGITLSAEAKEDEFLSAFTKLVAANRDTLALKDAKITELNTQVLTLKEAVGAAEAKAADDLALALVDGALGAKKITAAEKDKYLKLAKLDYATTKELLDAKKGYESINGQLKLGTADLSHEDKVKKYDELFKSNQLATLKTTNFEEFADLHNAKYGKEPKK